MPIFDRYRADSVKGRVYNAAVDRLLTTVADMETPTIAMIRGFAGGGELAVAADLRIASADSRLGISIGHREMQGLVNLVGKGNALYILLSGRRLAAAEALRIGLVNQVTPAAELESVTYQLAAEIAALAPLSHAANKRALQQVKGKPDAGGDGKTAAGDWEGGDCGSRWPALAAVGGGPKQRGHFA